MFAKLTFCLCPTSLVAGCLHIQRTSIPRCGRLLGALRRLCCLFSLTCCFSFFGRLCALLSLGYSEGCCNVVVVLEAIFNQPPRLCQIASESLPNQHCIMQCMHVDNEIVVVTVINKLNQSLRILAFLFFRAEASWEAFTSSTVMLCRKSEQHILWVCASAKNQRIRHWLIARTFGVTLQNWRGIFFLRTGMSKSGCRSEPISKSSNVTTPE